MKVVEAQSLIVFDDHSITAARMAAIAPAPVANFIVERLPNFMLNMLPVLRLIHSKRECECSDYETARIESMLSTALFSR